MGGGVSQDKKEFDWCAEHRLSCMQCLCSDLSRGKPVLLNLLRLSIAFRVPDLDANMVNEGCRDNLSARFQSALRQVLPTQDNNDAHWIIHYSPIIVVDNREGRRQGYLVVDRTALYVFVQPAPSWACGGSSEAVGALLPPLRIPFSLITKIIVHENVDEFSLVATTYAAAAENNFFKWPGPLIASEQTMKFHTTRRSEILRILQGMLNVLYFGQKPDLRKCQWTNMPEAIAALEETVHPLYAEAAQRDQCFSAKFMMYAMEKIPADDPHFYPDSWLATPPPLLHQYHAFYKKEYGSKGVIPRPPDGLYERVDGYRTEPIASPYLWSDINLRERLVSGCPPYRLPSLTAALNGNFSGAPGVVDVLALHGSAYASSSHTGPCTHFRVPKSSSEPSYALTMSGAVQAGGISWFDTTLNPEARLEADYNIARCALKALVYDHHHHTLSFDRCAVRGTVSDVMVALQEVLRHNTSLTSIAFPRHLDERTNAWKELAEALRSNPCPLFTSIDAGASRCDDAGLALLLPSLLHVYDKTKRGLCPVALRFEENNLTEVGVTELCTKLAGAVDLSHLQVLSLGGNRWATVGSCGALLKLLRIAKALKVLNVNSSGRPFPLMKQLVTALTETPCPLEEFAIGGCEIPSVEVDEWINSVLAICQAKKTTLKKVVIAGVHLRAHLASRLIGGLPAVALIITDDAVSFDAPGANIYLPVDTNVRELRLAKNAHYVLQWWRTMPRCLVVLDLSDIQNTAGVQQLFDALRDSLGSLRGAIPLQSLSLARVAAESSQVPTFKELVTILLLSEHIKLKALDITGCRGTDAILKCLGVGLRTNRTLATLKCDGQAPADNASWILQLSEGWIALRGSFYGNKKVVEFAYPWMDVSDYLRVVLSNVERGWREVANLKQQIGQAHRAFQMTRKTQLIQQLVAVKRNFMGLERTRCKVVHALHDICSSVEANAAMAAAIQESKLEAVWVSEKTDIVLAEIATKQDDLLSKLWSQLMTFAKTQAPQPTKARPPGAPPAPIAPSSAPSDGPPPPAMTTGDSPPLPGSPDDPAVRRAWEDIGASIASGPQLFTPSAYQRFVALVHSVGGHKDPKLSKTLKEADRLTAKAALKASTYKRTPNSFASAVQKTNPQVYRRYNFLNDRSRPYDWYEYDNYTHYHTVIYVDRPVDDGNNGDHGGHHHHHHHDKDTSNNNGQDDQGAGSGDPATDGPEEGGPNNVDGQGDGDNTGNNVGDGGDNGADAGGDAGGDAVAEGDGGGGDTGGDAGGGGDDVDQAVGMYAGAGPRDLPDGDADHDRDAGAARSGRRARWIHKHTALSANFSLPPPPPPSKLTVESPPALEAHQTMQSNWVKCLANVIDALCDAVARPLNYKVQPRFLSTKSSPQTSAAAQCTLVTQCSVDRLGRLEKQARAWGGCLSAAVYISTASAAERSTGLDAVKQLVQRLESDSAYTGQLMVSVLYGHEDSPWLWDGAGTDNLDGPLYPINALRNLAAVVVTTPLVFLVDVDFVPSAGLLQSVHSEPSLLQRCQQGELIVVPAFERMTCHTFIPAESSVRSVCAGLDDGSITAFHVQHFPAGHSPTNCAKWREISTVLDTATTAVLTTYAVQYAEYYEPYVIMARERFVPYDERFRGYGLNKCVHLRALAERGCSFHVLAGHFLLAECHERSVAHQRTYGSESGYRKHVVAAAYRAALRDIKAGKQPVVSAAMERLQLRLRKESGGTGKGMGIGKVKGFKKELKAAAARLLLNGKMVVAAVSAAAPPSEIKG